MHTERGTHAKVLVSWSNWMAGMNLDPKHLSLKDAKSKFEAIIGALNAEHGSEGSLPWVTEESAVRYARREIRLNTA